MKNTSGHIFLVNLISRHICDLKNIRRSFSCGKRLVLFWGLAWTQIDKKLLGRHRFIINLLNFAFKVFKSRHGKATIIFYHLSVWSVWSPTFTAFICFTNNQASTRNTRSIETSWNLSVFLYGRFNISNRLWWWLFCCEHGWGWYSRTFIWNYGK